MRATTSVGPPAATGTMTCTGLMGKLVWARAVPARRLGETACAADSAIKRRRVSMTTPRLSCCAAVYPFGRRLPYSANGRGGGQPGGPVILEEFSAVTPLE